jgi:hypothetical protein
MLKLVESLAAKAERAKRTTVEFLPLHQGISHHCLWCGQYAKGWQSYRAVDHSHPGGIKVMGEVCADRECHMSIAAKYPHPD